MNVTKEGTCQPAVNVGTINERHNSREMFAVFIMSVYTDLGIKMAITIKIFSRQTAEEGIRPIG